MKSVRRVIQLAAFRRLFVLLGGCAAITYSSGVARAEDNANSAAGVQEYKQSLILDVGVLQSRLFHVSSSIIRTSTSDPEIAMPIVLARDLLVLLGKKPGTVTLTLWGNDDTLLSMKLRVKADRLQSNTILPFMEVSALSLEENKMSAQTTAEYQNATVEYAGTLKSKAEKKSPPSSGKSDQRPETLDYSDLYSPSPGVALPMLTSKDDVFLPDKFETAIAVTLCSSQSRTLKLPQRIMKTSISNRSVADPVVVSQHEVILLGRKPGKATLAIKDDKGKVLGIELRVKTVQETHEDSSNSQFDPGDNLPPVPVAVPGFDEYKIGSPIDLQVAQPKMFRMKGSLIRVYISDGDIADLYPTKNGIFLLGKKVGQTELFLWDDLGNVSGMELRIAQAGKRDNKVTVILPNSDECAQPSSQQGTGQAKHPTIALKSRDIDFGTEIEYWTGEKKYILRCPVTK